MAELPGISNFEQPDGISQIPMSREGKTIPLKQPKSYEKILRENKI